MSATPIFGEQANLFMWQYLIPWIKNYFAHFKYKAVLSGSIASVSYLLNGDTVVIKSLVILVIVDWFFGVGVALKHKKFNSWRLKTYLYKMFFYFLLLIAANQAMRIHPVLDWLHQAIEVGIVLTEMKSIIENSALLGFKSAGRIEEKLNRLLMEKLK